MYFPRGRLMELLREMSLPENISHFRIPLCLVQVVELTLDI